jgi:hypothetical protein
MGQRWAHGRFLLPGGTGNKAGGAEGGAVFTSSSRVSFHRCPRGGNRPRTPLLAPRRCRRRTKGLGHPMATDIAFVWVCSRFLGVAIPLSLKIGMHATVAGVLLAFSIPARSYVDRDSFLKRNRWLIDLKTHFQILQKRTQTFSRWNLGWSWWNLRCTGSNTLFIPGSASRLCQMRVYQFWEMWPPRHGIP